jgi:hypothetical protein
MSERTAEGIRTEIADERRRLDEDLGTLQAYLRSVVRFLIAGIAVVALLKGGKSMRTGIRLIWKIL